LTDDELRIACGDLVLIKAARLFFSITFDTKVAQSQQNIEKVARKMVNNKMVNNKMVNDTLVGFTKAMSYKDIKTTQ
jgi:hypothetical protein